MRMQRKIKLLLLLPLFIITHNIANAQWLTNGSNIYFNTGNVGIGTTTPLEKLHVEGGRIYLNSGASVNGWNYSYFHWVGHSLVMGSRPGVYSHNAVDLKPGGASNGPLAATLRLYSAPQQDSHLLKIQFHTDGNSFINGGNVGIGTTTPGTYKLAVEGTLGARRIKVTQVPNWADFVFAPDYKLPSLQEVESFIKANQHLPGIPSEKEVKENGLDLGEMNKQLLQKVEELTLYIIKQEERIRALEEKAVNSK